jgi:hypothetical protein
MRPSMLRQLVTAASFVVFGGLIASTSETAAAAEDNACPVSDVEYAVSANVMVTNTPFGAANGLYSLGSGKIRLRVQGQPHEAETVKLMSYELQNRLTVEAKVAMVSTKVVTTSRTSTAGDVCDGSAQGTLRDGTLTWSTKVKGYHSDGTMECSGSMCGKFGAPPKGTSPLHDVPPGLTFNAFTFSPDHATFTMPYTLVSKSDSPSQTTYLTLSGRRVNEWCSAPAALECGGRLAAAD